MMQRIRHGMVAAMAAPRPRALAVMGAVLLVPPWMVASMPTGSAMAAAQPKHATTAAASPVAPTAPADTAPPNPGELMVKMQRATQAGPGDALGTVTIAKTDAGAEFRLKLHGLPPGQHGFHVHEDGECAPIFINGVRIPAGAAGGHWDPIHSNRHEGPMGTGHLGDLPLIEVAADGTATQTLTAPRIKDITALQGHALVIQTGGDNYSDDPIPSGGGGLRYACGLIQ